MLRTNPHQEISMAQIKVQDRPLSKQAMRERVEDLLRQGRVTERDELVMQTLQELSVLSVDHCWRLFWRDKAKKTTLNRLSIMAHQYHLLSSPRAPFKQMERWGLSTGKVYSLSTLGQYWLEHQFDRSVPSPYRRQDQTLHDLLVAEVYIRTVETALKRGKTWSAAWVGEQGASFYPAERNNTPMVAPDGLGMLSVRQGDTDAILAFFIELDASREAHGALSSDWGRKVIGYDRYYNNDNWRVNAALQDLPEFPAVMVVTHGAERMQNLAHAIAEKRKRPVVYYLTLWRDLLLADDLYAAPIWMAISGSGQIIGLPVEERLAILPLDQGK